MNRFTPVVVSLLLLSTSPAFAAGLTITNPAVTTKYCKKQTIPIRWNSNKAGNRVRIELLKGNSRYKTIKARYQNTGAFDWTIPLTIQRGKGYRIRVLSHRNRNIYAKSQSFTIGGAANKCRSFDVVVVDAGWKAGGNFPHGLGNAAALDLDGDGDHDIVNVQFQPGGKGINDRYYYPISIFINEANYRFKSNSKARRKIRISPKARASFGRNVLTADFNQDGLDDFYVMDATEWYGPKFYQPFEGAQQFVYISKRPGSYRRVKLGVGKVTAHGAGIGDFNSDGYPDIAFNTLSNSRPAKPNIGIAFYNPSTGRFSQSRINEPDGMSSDNWGWSLYFYLAVLDVNNDGATDVLALSPTDRSSGHRIFLNDGRGTFTFDRTFDLGGNSEYLTIESVAVGDFNGDGYSDFAALALDRNPSTWGSKAVIASWLQVFINNKKGFFSNQSKRFLGAKYQNRRLGTRCYAGRCDGNNYYVLHSLDANGDGLTDLAVTPSTAPPYVGEFAVLTSTGKRFKKKIIAKRTGPRLLVMNEHGTKRRSPQILFEHNGKVKMVLFRH